ncbi:DUF481 domain-containing protein [Membranicola marinus]|uniref:DUF481 domain-containing protein n=1 Tax=Membranihabitans marinus TaxID=1227546 RepID=A0A953L7H7_9BACT|nr:DUF481 domain-containing protein [Membranihabitans marinus]MBY5958737.1 DUF481 domain-containing protein [Membranihabitans marinus]
MVQTIAFTQIVNVETLRKQTDTTGFAGNIALNGSYLDNEKIIYSLGIQSHIQHKWQRDILILVGDYKINKSEEVAFQNAAFLHLRYSHEFTDLLRWESFTQIQHNKIARLDFRILAGSGLRLKLVGENSFRMYLGILPMYEYEQIKNDDQDINTNVRLSNYLSMTFQINDHTQLYSTSYYQPALGKISDYRFFNEQKLKVGLNENLLLTVSSVYTWDNRPPEDAPGRTFQIKTGLEYNF